MRSSQPGSSRGSLYWKQSYNHWTAREVLQWSSAWNHFISYFHKHTSVSSILTLPQINWVLWNMCLDLSSSPCFHQWNKAVGLNDLSDLSWTSHGYGKFRFIHVLLRRGICDNIMTLIHTCPYASFFSYPLSSCASAENVLYELCLDPSALCPTFPSDAARVPGLKHHMCHVSVNVAQIDSLWREKVTGKLYCRLIKVNNVKV